MFSFQLLTKTGGTASSRLSEKQFSGQQRNKMKKVFILLAGVAAVTTLASCNKELNAPKIDFGEMQGSEISVMNGIATKGYVDDATFYEKETAKLHEEGVAPTPRTMRLSAYFTPAAGQTAAPGDYFVDQEFAYDATKTIWRHNPPIYWPLASHLDFLAYSSTEPFGAKDALWNSKNASSSVVLTFDGNRTQDDVLYSSQEMDSADNTTGASYTNVPVNMTFQHAQAWLEFQLSIASEEMKDLIAIKDIYIASAAKSGKLTLTRDEVVEETCPSGVKAEWKLDDADKMYIDDVFGVYGGFKAADDASFDALNQAIADAESDLADAQSAYEEAVAGGNAEDMAAKEAALNEAKAALAAVQESLAAALAKCELNNPLNIVGGAHEAGSSAESSAEVSDKCAFLDMLIPAQAKSDIVIEYVLAGQNKVLEYRYPLNTGSKWEMGNKYIYDIDFVITEITVNPTVKEFVAQFDGEAVPTEIH